MMGSKGQPGGKKQPEKQPVATWPLACAPCCTSSAPPSLPTSSLPACARLPRPPSTPPTPFAPLLLRLRPPPPPAPHPQRSLTRSWCRSTSSHHHECTCITCDTGVKCGWQESVGRYAPFGVRLNLPTQHSLATASFRGAPSQSRIIKSTVSSNDFSHNPNVTGRQRSHLQKQACADQGFDTEPVPRLPALTTSQTHCGNDAPTLTPPPQPSPPWPSQ